MRLRLYCEEQEEENQEDGQKDRNDYFMTRV